MKKILLLDEKHPQDVIGEFNSIEDAQAHVIDLAQEDEDISIFDYSIKEVEYEDGNLYDKGESIPCPFCRTEEFIECDYFGKVDEICYELMEDDSLEQYAIHIEEAKQKAREWYLNWIKGIKERYA